MIAAVALVLPGFVIADLSQQARATRAWRTDWELVLRALFYAVLLHLVFSPWTASLVRELDDRQWQDRVGSIALYGLVVIVAVPIAGG